MENKYTQFSLSVKEVYTDKDKNEKHKWHNAGILFKDKDGKMFGIINIFGSKIKFSVFPFNKDGNIKKQEDAPHIPLNIKPMDENGEDKELPF